MDTKSNLHPFFIFLLILIHLLGFFCQEDLDYSNCGQPFKCANISSPMITYPFWDVASVVPGNSSPCGHPSFGLDCSGPFPTLNISGVPYRIIDFDFFSFVITVTRQDQYRVDPCNPLPVYTTLNSTLFQLVPNFRYKNLTLYYNCTEKVAGLPNRFSCGSKMTNFFQTGNHDPTNFTCDQHITVPMSLPDAARELKTATDLFEAARTGYLGSFAIKWLADNRVCEECSRVGSTCAYYHKTLNSSGYYNNSLNSSGYYNNTLNLSRHYNNSLNSNGFYCYAGPTKRRPVDPRDKPAQQPSPPGHPRSHAAESKSAREFKNFMGSNQRRIKLGLSFGVVVFVLAFLFLCWRYKAKRLHGDPKNKAMEVFLVEHRSLYPKRYKYSDIKKITKSFSDKLGKGGYGSVYKGTLSNGCHVAVKVLKEMDSNDEEFINEVASIGRTSHINIVSLVGFCYERKKRALVYEFMPNKSLDKFIEVADTGKLYNIAVGVAKGLEYLHRGCNTSIIHFDIKPQNILLDEDFCPKISDFGLAKMCKKKQSILSVLGTRGTVGYIAPEVFSRNFGKVSHKSDVYSYGVMVLEMAGAKKFVEAETIQSSENYFPDKIYKDVMEYGHAMTNEDYNESLVDQEDEMVRKMFLIGFWCIQTIPSDRPSMSNVVEMLEGNLELIQVPPKPFLFNPKLMGQEFSPELSIRVDVETSTEESSLLSS